MISKNHARVAYDFENQQFPEGRNGWARERLVARDGNSGGICETGHGQQVLGRGGEGADIVMELIPPTENCRLGRDSRRVAHKPYRAHRRKPLIRHGRKFNSLTAHNQMFLDTVATTTQDLLFAASAVLKMYDGIACKPDRVKAKHVLKDQLEACSWLFE